MKYRMEETLEDIDDLEIPKLKFESDDTPKKVDKFSFETSPKQSRRTKVEEEPDVYVPKTFKCDECDKEFREGSEDFFLHFFTLHFLILKF